MSKIRMERHGPVRTVTLARPEKRNALDSAMLAELEAAFAEAPDEGDRVVVIRADGPVFCAGIDLAERKGMQERGVLMRDSSPIETVLHRIEHYPLPVVAVVQGDAIAGGNELALHCDLVIAAETARFGMSLAQIGLAPSWFLAKKLLEVAGPVTTREILLLGDPVPAGRLCALGVIARAVPAADLESAADAVIARLAANAPLSLKAMKQLLVREMAFRDGIEHGDIDQLVTDARNSADAREGIAARMERRPPRFTGR